MREMVSESGGSGPRSRPRAAVSVLSSGVVWGRLALAVEGCVPELAAAGPISAPACRSEATRVYDFVGCRTLEPQPRSTEESFGAFGGSPVNGSSASAAACGVG